MNNEREDMTNLEFMTVLKLIKKIAKDANEEKTVETINELLEDYKEQNKKS